MARTALARSILTAKRNSKSGPGRTAIGTVAREFAQESGIDVPRNELRDFFNSGKPQSISNASKRDAVLGEIRAQYGTLKEGLKALRTEAQSMDYTADPI